MTDVPAVHAPHSHNDTLSVFTKKYGPLPGYVYALLIVGAYVGWRYYQSRKEATVGATAPLSYDTGSYGAGTNPDGTTGTTGGITGSDGTGAVSVPGGVSVGTNAQWTSAASNELIAEGYPPTDVSNALSNYINGKALTVAQQAIVNIALQKFGTPPGGVLPVTVTPMPPVVTPKPPVKVIPKPPIKVIPKPKPAPKPAAKPAPPKYHTYVIQHGDTLSGIASRFHVKGGYMTLWNLNTNLHKSGSPNLIHAGTPIKIPT